MIKRLPLILLACVGLILSACTGEEPERTRIGQGDLDSLEGFKWTAFAS